MSPLTCAAPGCDNPVARRPGTVGRPPIYCSPGCRASGPRRGVVVEVGQETDEEAPGRDWVVRLRRGTAVVVIGRGLGRFSATALATDLGSVLGGSAREKRP